MKTTFLIDGGLGRQIAAIPALEKFVSKNPDTTIITYFWTPMYWGNPLLAPRTFDSNTKGIFDMIKNSKIVKVEPYYNNNYINGKISMADAFNEEINGDNDKMPVPKIYLSPAELKRGRNIAKQNSKKVICFQPFGSTANFENNDVYDNTVRSMSREFAQTVIEMFKRENFDVAFFDDREIGCIDRSKLLNIRGVDCRVWASIIANCDYFVGCDSSGQHIARTFDVPGAVFVGGTSEVNTSYPDFFTILKKEGPKSYMSYRLADFDYWLSELQNSDLMTYTTEEMINATKVLVQEAKKQSKGK